MAEAQEPRTDKYLKNDGDWDIREPRRQLKKSLQYLVDKYPPDKKGLDLHSGGLYTGAISIAFTLMAISEFYSDLKLELKDEAPVSLSVWLTAYLDLIKDNMSRPEFYDPPTPQECGIHNSVMSAIAMTAALTKDADLVLALCSFNKTVLDPTASNEWMFGRAGYLYLLRLVRTSLQPVKDEETGEWVRQTEDEELISDLVDQTIKSVIMAIMDSPRPWKWHKHYLGAAHGDAGIITQIILTEPHILDDNNDLFSDIEGADPKVTSAYPVKLKADLGVLLAYQGEDGNWPSSTPGGKRDLVQFCHGAPGVVSSLVSIRDRLDEEGIRLEPATRDRIDTAISKGRKCIWEKGLLTKEPCLCHGISGNALALAPPNWPDADGPDADKAAPPNQFEHFLSYTSQTALKNEDYVESDKKYKPSLYGGAAGRVWAWSVADKREKLRFLGYNDI